MEITRHLGLENRNGNERWMLVWWRLQDTWGWKIEMEMNNGYSSDGNYKTLGSCPATGLRGLRGVSKQRPTVYKRFGLRSSLQSRGRQSKRVAAVKWTNSAVKWTKSAVKWTRSRQSSGQGGGNWVDKAGSREQVEVQGVEAVGQEDFGNNLIRFKVVKFVRIVERGLSYSLVNKNIGNFFG